jgi:cobalamin biosynthesis protein CobT
MKPTPLHKALPIVAQTVADKHGVRVNVGGDVAATDGKNIVIPTLPENDEARILARGFVDHEAAHIRFTDFEVQPDNLTNALEDIRIEEKLSEMFPGSRKNLADLSAHLVDSGKIQVAPEAPDIDVLGKYIILKQRRDRMGHNLDNIVQEIEDLFEDRFGLRIKKQVDKLLGQKLTSTKKVNDIAQELYRILRQKRQQDLQGPQGQQSDDDTEGDSQGEGSQDVQSDQDGQGQADQTTLSEDQESGSDAESDSESESDDGGHPSESSSSGGRDQDDDENEEGAESSASGGGSGEAEEEGDESSPAGQSEQDDTDAGAAGSEQSDEDTDSAAPDNADGASASAGTDQDEEESDQSGSKASGSAGAGKEQSGEGADEADYDPDMESSLPGVGELLRQELEEHNQGQSQNQQGSLGGINPGNGEMSQQMSIPRDVPPRCSPAALPFNVADAARASAKLRKRLTGVLEAKVRDREQVSRSGKHFAKKDLYRLGVKDTRVFTRKQERNAPNTAIHILLDRSGSMGHDLGQKMSRSLEVGYAVGRALDKLPRVQYALTAFPGLEGDNYVDRIKKFNERLDTQKMGIKPDNYTPTPEAMWYAAYTLASRREERKMIFVVTDGEPDDPESTIMMDRWLRQCGVEVVGIGIMLEHIKEIFRDNIVIQNLDELAPELFGLLEKKL